MAEPGGNPPNELSRVRVADQLIEELQTRIADGTYERGGRLPSERELATAYHVSSPTVREALRALSSMGLVEVRHGSGTYVASSSTAILDGSLSMLVEWEKVSYLELFGLLKVLNRYIAELAVEMATEEEAEAVLVAARATGRGRHVKTVTSSVERFLATFVACAHQPLLDAFCGFLNRKLLQSEVRVLPQRTEEEWEEWTRQTLPWRIGIAEALMARDTEALVEAVNVYHDSVAANIAQFSIPFGGLSGS